MPRQMLPPTYEHVGYVDVIRPRTILEHGSMVGSVVLPYLIDEPTYDLDYPHQIPALERALGEPKPARRPSAAPGPHAQATERRPSAAPVVNRA